MFARQKSFRYFSFCISGFLFLFLIALQSAALATSSNSGSANKRLIKSESPYLRLHSTDLVQWYTWGDEAFELARSLDRPLMVSFGYTACHWCHVMQETHFTEPKISNTINEHFVPVIVDRERRTALDESYMLVTQALTQSGGWPNTVFITPEGKPFYGTSYIPPESFQQLLEAIKGGWTNNRPVILADSDRLASLLIEYQTRKEEALQITPEVLAELSREISASFDPVSGGLGAAPKFFQPPVLKFLLRRYEMDKDKSALAAVERTLQSVAYGGIHDHLEGGFHRYAVDPNWRIPHFEKMLYDQAQMADVYLEAYRITGNELYAQTARKTLDYVLADLLAPEGGFYSTRDADSEGEEGTYYVWKSSEIEEILGKDDGEKAARMFGIIADGEFQNKIILNLDSVPPSEMQFAKEAFGKMKTVRDRRIKPVRDEKIIAAWNGMMIASLASASHILNEPRYGEAASAAGEFVWKEMRSSDAVIYRSYFEGKPSLDSELDDVAQVGLGMVRLFDITGEPKWIDRAIELSKSMVSRFADEETGDFFATDSTLGFGRVKLRSDNDQPSGNGSALDLLTRVAKRVQDFKTNQATEKAISALSGFAVKGRSGGVSILSAIDQYLRSETGPFRYAGDGVVRVTGPSFVEDGKLSFKLSIAEGWHINAHKPHDHDLIPTTLELNGNNQKASTVINYPEAETKQLSFSDSPVAVLEGELEISANVKDQDNEAVTAVLAIQSCSDKVCLLPERLEFRIHNLTQ